MLGWLQRWDRGDFFGWLSTFTVSAFFGGFHWPDAVWLVPTVIVGSMLASEYLTPVMRRIERWRARLAPEAVQRLQLALALGVLILTGLAAALAVTVG